MVSRLPGEKDGEIIFINKLMVRATVFHKHRPTFKLNSVFQVWKRRRREYMLKSAVSIFECKIIIELINLNIYVLSAQKNHLIETVLLSTLNIWLRNKKTMEACLTIFIV